MKINDSIQNSYTQLSTAKRINSASDDPAGLAIAEKMTAQIKGYDKGTDNALTAKDLSNTAEGALSSVNDSLQRIRELAVQASNGTYTADDKQAIQKEINQLKGAISESSKNTEFNTLKVLDGSFANKTIVTNPSGNGRQMTIENTSLEALGINDFDVTKNFNIDDIDAAAKMVSESRASLGATSNSLDRTVASNTTAANNLNSAESQISGADIAKTLTDLKTQQIKQQVQIYAQQSKTNQGSNIVDMLR